MLQNGKPENQKANEVGMAGLKTKLKRKIKQ
jgi:hypothetical protein